MLSESWLKDEHPYLVFVKVHITVLQGIQLDSDAGLH